MCSTVAPFISHHQIVNPQERGGEGIGDSLAPIERKPMGSGQTAHSLFRELSVETAF